MRFSGAATHEGITYVVVAVRSILTEEACFSTGAVPCHLSLPAGDIFDLIFDLGLDLQVNLIARLYLVETGVRSFAQERMI